MCKNCASQQVYSSGFFQNPNSAPYGLSEFIPTPEAIQRSDTVIWDFMGSVKEMLDQIPLSLFISKIQALLGKQTQRHLIKHFKVLSLTESILPYPIFKNLIGVIIFKIFQTMCYPVLWQILILLEAKVNKLYSLCLQLSFFCVNSVSYTHLTLPTTPYV